MRIEDLDHLVLTVRSISETLAFYGKVLGMKEITFGGDRKALVFGRHKINLHQRGQEFEPKAAHPTSGSADLCFVTSTPIRECVEHLLRHGVEIIEGPVERTGAQGALISVYVRDPDRNLVEISNHLPPNG